MTPPSVCLYLYPPAAESPPPTSPARSPTSPIGTPLEGIRNVAGPDVFSPRANSAGSPWRAQHDNRTVIANDTCVGMLLGVTGDMLTAGPDAHLAPTHYQDWIQTAR